MFVAMQADNITDAETGEIAADPCGSDGVYFPGACCWAVSVRCYSSGWPMKAEKPHKQQHRLPHSGLPSSSLQ